MPLSFALCLAQHLGVLSTVALAGGYRQVAGGFMVLKSRIWSRRHLGGDKYVDDVCPQYLHCTVEDQQSETARLSIIKKTPAVPGKPETMNKIPATFDRLWNACGQPDSSIIHLRILDKEFLFNYARVTMVMDNRSGIKSTTCVLHLQRIHDNLFNRAHGQRGRKFRAAEKMRGPAAPRLV